MIRYDEQIVRIFLSAAKNFSHEICGAIYPDTPRTSRIADIIAQQIQNKSPWPEPPVGRPRGLLDGLDDRVTVAPVSARAPTRPSENSISKAIPALTAVALRNG
jgi:hypothetical protein